MILNKKASWSWRHGSSSTAKMLITSWAFQNLPHSESSLAVSQLATWKPHWIGGWSNFPSPSFGHGIQCFHLIFKIDHLTANHQPDPASHICSTVCKQPKASHVITRRNCEHSTWCLLLAIARNTRMINSERSQFMAFWVRVDQWPTHRRWILWHGTHIFDQGVLAAQTIGHRHQAQSLMTFPSVTWNCSNPPDSKKQEKIYHLVI